MSNGAKPVFTSAEVIKAIASKGLTFEKKKENTAAPKAPAAKVPAAKGAAPKGAKSKVIRYRVLITSPRPEHKGAKFPLIMSLKGVKTTVGMTDPSNTDREVYGCTFTTSMDASGEVGKVVVLLEKEFKSFVTNAQASGEIDKKKPIFDMIQTKYKTGDKEGQDLPSPSYRLHNSFELYPETFFDINLRGKPHTEILDATKYVLDDTGKPKTNAPVVIDGEPANKDNLHKFVTRGSTIESGRMDASQFTISNFGVSYRLDVLRAVIRPAQQMSGYEDDDELIVADGNDSGPSTPVTSSSSMQKTATDTADDTDADSPADDTAADDAVDAGYDADNADG